MGRIPRLVADLAGDRRGVSAIVIGLSLTAIMGFAGLAVDAGLWYADKRQAQNAADAAAWTATWTYLDEGQTTSAATNAKATAISVASTYGLTNGTNGVTVVVNNPPTSGTHTSNNAAFEVIITKPESLFFSSLFLSSLSVASRGVAGVVTTGGGGVACVLQLQGTSYAETYVTNGITVTLNQCGLAGNGTGSGAVTAIGGANITAATANIVGGVTTNNGGSFNISGSKVTGGSATANPYASVTVAAAEGSDNLTCPNSTPTSYQSGGASYTINPGVYCGGLTIANGVKVTMNPGVYVIEGGVFSLQGGTTTNATGGVTIVLTGSGSNYAVANIANGVTFNLTAPSTGTTAGIAILGDVNAPGLTSTMTNSNSCGSVASDCNFIGGGANMNVTGAIDTPSQGVQFTNGSTNGTACTQLIAAQITFTGGVKFSNNCTGTGTSQIGGSTSTVTFLE
jgi:Flp pilus assembly protein TadG